VEDWRAFASAARFGPGFVLRRVLALADSVLASLPEVGAGIVAQGGDEHRVARVVDVIKLNAGRMRDDLHRALSPSNSLNFGAAD